MDREIKFRYTCKRENGHIFSEIFNLKDIEAGRVALWYQVNTIGGRDKVFRDQFTGLKDKQGKEIYEGDIVIQDLWGKAVVKFGGGTNMGGGDSSAFFYGYYIEVINRRDAWGNNEADSSSFHNTNEVEVIGNIYENLELLTGVKKNG